MLHLDPGQGVQRTQRFIQQQQPRLVNQRAGQRYALLLPTGQGRRPFIGTFGQADRVQRLQGLGPPVAGQAQADVVDHPLPGQQTRVLEHQADITARRRQSRITGAQYATAGLIQPGQQAQQGALAATTAANHRNELPGGNAQVDVVQHLPRAEGLVDAVDGQRQAAFQTVENAHCPPALA